MAENRIPPNQQLVGTGRWPLVGERSPDQSNEPWSLRIEGLVKRPYSLDLAEFAALPQSVQTIDIHCVTRWTRLDVSFSGVFLRELFDRAEVRPEAKYVSFVARSARGHSSSMVLSEALELQTMIAREANGQPLPLEHGGPLRSVVPGRYFYKSVKWVERIELLAENRLGFWEATAGYHDHADPWREERYVASQIDRRRARQLIESRDFAGLDLRGIQCAQRDLENLNARDALLRDANFSNARLTGADFSGANLSNANFSGADLRGARFVGGDLEGAELSGADLRGANFENCSWFGTSLCRVDASGEFIDGAILDRTTRVDPNSVEQLTEQQRRYFEMAYPVQ
jgi:DMSO/TMAO reductase YedYZ molybdopterin-dependent catalytic subunit